MSFGRVQEISWDFSSSFNLVQVLTECLQVFVGISLRSVEEIMFKHEIPWQNFALYLVYFTKVLSWTNFFIYHRFGQRPDGCVITRILEYMQDGFSDFNFNTPPMKGSYSCRIKKTVKNYLGIKFSVKQEHQRRPRNPGTFLSILLHREKWSPGFENFNSRAQVKILKKWRS